MEPDLLKHRHKSFAVTDSMPMTRVSNKTSPRIDDVHKGSWMFHVKVKLTSMIMIR